MASNPAKLLTDPNALDPAQLMADAENFGAMYEGDPADMGEPQMLRGIDPMDDLDVPVNPPGGRDMLLAPGDGNAAKLWQQRQPVLNVQQMAAQNQALLSGNPQTTRFYTRKLLRMAMGSSNPAVREEARAASRIQGAPTPPPGFGMGPAASTVFGQGNRPMGPTDSAAWRSLFPPANERRQSGEPLPPPVTGGDWSSIFNDTRANDFGAGSDERPGQVFNPGSGQLEFAPKKPSLLNDITDKIIARADALFS